MEVDTAPKEKKISLDPPDEPKPNPWILVGKESEKDLLTEDHEMADEKEEKKEELKELPPINIKLETTCFGCKAELEEGDKACRKCGTYVLGPGEAIDLSDSKIKFPIDWISASTTLTKKVDDPFSAPCPPSKTENICDDQDVQTWAFNHLPLKEDQKESMLLEICSENKITLKDLAKMKAKEKRTKTVMELLAERKKEKKNLDSSRRGVKDKKSTPRALLPPSLTRETSTSYELQRSPGYDVLPSLPTPPVKLPPKIKEHELRMQPSVRKLREPGGFTIPKRRH